MDVVYRLVNKCNNIPRCELGRVSYTNYRDRFIPLFKLGQSSPVFIYHRFKPVEGLVKAKDVNWRVINITRDNDDTLIDLIPSILSPSYDVFLGRKSTGLRTFFNRYMLVLVNFGNQSTFSPYNGSTLLRNEKCPHRPMFNELYKQRLCVVWGVTPNDTLQVIPLTASKPNASDSLGPDDLHQSIYRVPVNIGVVKSLHSSYKHKMSFAQPGSIQTVSLARVFPAKTEDGSFENNKRHTLVKKCQKQLMAAMSAIYTDKVLTSHQEVIEKQRARLQRENEDFMAKMQAFLEHFEPTKDGNKLKLHELLELTPEEFVNL